MPRRRNRISKTPVTATIESLSHEGRGIASVDGRKVFIDGALPGETVRFSYRKKNARIADADLVEIIQSSRLRIDPACKHYGICGGCSMQHMSAHDQLEHKQGVLLEQFRHIGAVEPESILPALSGPEWGYRHKARIGLKYVIKKDRLLIGFREKGSGKLADLETCEVLHPVFGHQLIAIRTLVQSLGCFNNIPQVEIAAGDDHCAMIVRHLQVLQDQDRQLLAQFQQDTGISILLQAGGPETVIPLNDSSHTLLGYRVPDFNLAMQFAPGDFTQINFRLNGFMINQAVNLLSLLETDTVLDLFCGIGNFSLPMAMKANHVTGVEGENALVDRARHNARNNGIDNIDFRCLDLAREIRVLDSGIQDFNKMLIDPPRSGAREIIEHLDFQSIEKLVYVSCNPATLARDAGMLVRDHGYRLIKAGIMNMFPQTSHIEAIALFEKA